MPSHLAWPNWRWAVLTHTHEDVQTHIFTLYHTKDLKVVRNCQTKYNLSTPTDSAHEGWLYVLTCSCVSATMACSTSPLLITRAFREASSVNPFSVTNVIFSGVTSSLVRMKRSVSMLSSRAMSAPSRSLSVCLKDVYVLMKSRLTQKNQGLNIHRRFSCRYRISLL